MGFITFMCWKAHVMKLKQKVFNHTVSIKYFQRLALVKNEEGENLPVFMISSYINIQFLVQVCKIYSYFGIVFYQGQIGRGVWYIDFLKSQGIFAISPETFWDKQVTFGKMELIIPKEALLYDQATIYLSTTCS